MDVSDSKQAHAVPPTTSPEAWYCFCSTLHFYTCCIQVDVDVSDSKQAPAVPPTTDAMVAEVIVLFALGDL